MQVLAVALALGLLFLVFGGWPLVAFYHYRYRKQHRLSEALFLTIAPGLGAVLIFMVVQGAVEEWRRLPWLAVPIGLSGFAFLIWPYVILTRLPVGPFRRLLK